MERLITAYEVECYDPGSGNFVLFRTAYDMEEAQAFLSEGLEAVDDNMDNWSISPITLHCM